MVAVTMVFLNMDFIIYKTVKVIIFPVKFMYINFWKILS